MTDEDKLYLREVLLRWGKAIGHETEETIMLGGWNLAFMLGPDRFTMKEVRDLLNEKDSEGT